MLIKKITKLFLVFGLSLLLAWLTKSYFAQLYVWVEKPSHNPGSLLLLPVAHFFEGFFVGLFFWLVLLNFLLSPFKNKWKSLLIIMLPILFISLGAWNLFIWYAAMFVVGWLFARVILFIFKVLKK